MDNIIAFKPQKTVLTFCFDFLRLGKNNIQDNYQMIIYIPVATVTQNIAGLEKWNKIDTMQTAIIKNIDKIIIIIIISNYYLRCSILSDVQCQWMWIVWQSPGLPQPS
jgi:hypothetical protein